MAVGGVATAALKPPSQTTNTGITSTFDNSAWSVNVGPGASQTTSKTDLPTTAQALGAAAASAGSLLSSPVFIIAVGIGLFLFLKHK